MMKLCKFYRYFIYRIYHLNNDIPVIRVLGYLSFMHASHLLCYVFFLSRILCVNLIVLGKLEKYIDAIIFLGLHYILFYNKEKWEEYFKEFENESKEERKKGTIKVWGYFIGSILIPISIIILVSELFPQ